MADPTNSPWRPVTVGSPSFRSSPAAQVRRLQLVRQLSCEVLNGAAADNSPTQRMPLFPLPPPITIASPASFGSFSDVGEDIGDNSIHAGAGSLSGSANHKAKVMRVRSFGASSRLSSLLGPSRASGGGGGGSHLDLSDLFALPSSAAAPAPAGAGQASAFGRPPPIRTVASLEGMASPSLVMAPPTSVGGPTTSSSSSHGGGALASIFPAAAAAATPAAPRPFSFAAPPDISAAASPRTPDIAAPTPRRQRSRQSFAMSLAARNGGRSGRCSPMSKVAACLYVGDERAAANLGALRSAGVTHVLNCTAHPNSLENDPDAPRYMQLGLLDSTADLPRMQSALEKGVDFIAEAIRDGGTVLVHCHRGISRSATLAMAYLVRSTQQPVDTVFEQMRHARRCIDPNLGYMCALKEWEQRVLPPSLVRSRSSATNSPAMPRPLSRA